MRRTVIGLSLALLVSVPLIAVAQAPVTTQQLANGELLLQLGAIGVETVPADVAIMTASLMGRGETEAAARADLDRRYRALAAAAQGAGVPASAISQSEIRASSVDDMAMMNAVAAMDDNMAMAESSPMMSASSTVIIRVTEMGRIAAARRAIEATIGNDLGSLFVMYSLDDNRAARQAARTRALATVRAEAETYAASLNMRVARMVRISERTGVELLPHLFGDTTLMRSVGGGPFNFRESNITVPVAVGVDFVLVPR